MPEEPTEPQSTHHPVDDSTETFWDQYLVDEPAPSLRSWERRTVRRIGFGLLAVILIGVGTATILNGFDHDARRPRGSLVPVPEADATLAFDDPALAAASAPADPDAPPTAPGSRTIVRRGGSGATGAAPVTPDAGPTPAPSSGDAPSPPPPAPATTTPAPAGPLKTGEVSVFSAGAGDPMEFTEPAHPDIELGMRFTTSAAGTAKGIMFYRLSATETAPTGSLWDAAGNKIGSVVFAAGTDTGWIRADFATPIALNPGQTYTVSYHVSNGIYTAQKDVFTSEIASGPLRAPAGSNGVYRYGPTAFPTESFGSPSYFVDIVFVAP